MYPKIVLFDYNGLRVSIKSTTPISIGMFTAVIGFRPGLYSADIFDYNQHDFMEYELPLELFKQNDGERLAPSGHNLDHIAIVARGKENTPFHFWIKSATLINNPQIDLVKETYKQNVMFKRKNSYLDEGLDIGCGKFVVPKPTNTNNNKRSNREFFKR